MSAPRSSTSTAGAPHRSKRSLRTLVAVALLLTAVVAGVGAIVAGTATVLAVAVAWSVVAGCAAARLLANETAQVRRDWARDRASIAHVQSREATRRQREHVGFAEAMARRVRAGELEVARLVDAVAAAEANLAETEARAAAEAERADALDADLGTTRTALLEARTEVRTLRDALAASESAELEARTELLAWQQRADDKDQRRYA